NAPTAYLTYVHDGELPASGSLLDISNPDVELVMVDTVDGKLVFTLQNRSDKSTTTVVKTPAVFKNVSLPPWQLTKVEL
ncbi:MAG: hypothetical protein IKS67_09905, partial [Victivallales bacterium]|nr:hypothetical protein [Victivallales bacterium]